MSFLRNLAASNTVEHITLTTTSAAAVSGAFTTLTSDQLSDVAIQNLSAGACYITFGTSEVIATSDHLYMAGNSAVSLTNTALTHYSIIRVTTDVNVRITGIGAV